jgi:predicted nucleic acid-binding protein
MCDGYILRRLSFYDELAISTSSVQKAYALCADIDEKDTPFVALTIELNGLLWSGDRELSDGLRTKGFDSFYVP